MAVFDGIIRSRFIGVVPSRRCSARWQHVGDVIDDHLGVSVEDHHVTIDEAVLKVVGQDRQLAQEQWRHRRQRRLLRIGPVDGQLSVPREPPRQRPAARRASGA